MGPPVTYAISVVALAGLLPDLGRSKSWPAGCISFFRLLGWSAVVSMLGLMDLFATTFISFTSENWQAVKWNFGLDFSLTVWRHLWRYFVFVLRQPEALWLSRREEKLFTLLIFLSEKESLCWGQPYLAYIIRTVYLFQWLQCEGLTPAG